MILEDGQWRVRDLVMGPHTPYRVAASSNSFVLSTRSDQSGPRAHAHGGFTGNQWAQPRVVPIRVMIDADIHTEAEWLAAVDVLGAAWHPTGATGETVELHRNIAGREFVWFGQPGLFEPDPEIAAGGYGWVQLGFTAADPRRYSAALMTLSTGLPVQQGGLTIPAELVSTHLVVPGVVGANATTPDHASLDITGDIDLRVDVSPASWDNGTNQDFVAKWDEAGTGNGSYILGLSSGRIRLVWSVDGTAAIARTSSVDVGAVNKTRLAVRATLDVDDGVGNHTATFYTAPTIDGPWVELGVADTTAGTTSIFSGDAAPEIGTLSAGTLARTVGLVHTAEIRSGVDGTIAADPDFTAQNPATTSFADSTGKTWTVNGAAAIQGVFRPGLTIPYVIPGVLVGGSGTLMNTGTTNTGVQVRISLDAAAAQPLVEPWFVLQLPDGTVQSVRFDLTLSPGQFLDIDSTTHLALLNGLPQSNQRGRATWLLESHPLPPGDSTFRFGSGGEFNEAATATITWRSAWM